MVSISYSAGSDCYFSFSGLSDVVPAKYQPLSDYGNELRFFLDLLKRNGITVKKTKTDICSAVMEDGDAEYECVSGKIRFTLVHDMYWGIVSFRVNDAAQRSTLADRLKALIMKASSEKA